MAWLGSLFPEPAPAVAEPGRVVKPRKPKEPPQRVREVPELASGSARVFAMSDGSFEAEVSPEPQRYRDGAGKWRPIDLSVWERARDGYRFSSGRNAFVARFGERTDRLVRFERAGKRVALGVDGAVRAVAPKVDGARVTYPGAFDGADVQYVVTPEGVKENIVLARRVEVPAFRFTLRTSGVRAREQGDGSIGFFDTRSPDGPPVFVMPRPFMTDSRADAKSPYGKSFSDKVTQSVEQRGANVTVTLRANEKWLDARERRYPVTIDPTIRIEPTPTAGQDAQIWSDTPDRADGLDYRLSGGTDPWGRARSLVRFDTSVVPAGTALASAKLRLYYDNELHTGANNVTIEARRVTAPWVEDTVTWNSVNTAMGEAGLSTVVKQANKTNAWHELDVRNIAHRSRRRRSESRERRHEATEGRQGVPVPWCWSKRCAGQGLRRAPEQNRARCESWPHIRNGRSRSCYIRHHS